MCSPHQFQKEGKFFNYVYPASPPQQDFNWQYRNTKKEEKTNNKKQGFKKWLEIRDGCLNGLSLKVWLQIMRRKTPVNIDFHMLI